MKSDKGKVTIQCRQGTEQYQGKVILMLRIVKTLGFIVLASLVLASCGKRVSLVTPYSPAQIAQAILTGQAGISALEPLLPDDDYYADYLSDIYRLDSGLIKDGIICYANGMQADEIAVFRLIDNSAAAEVKESLESYKERRADAFRGYAPVQAGILDNGIVAFNGEYIALLICEDAQKAQSVFMACFSDSPPLIDYEFEPVFADEINKAPENEPETAAEISEPPFIKEKTDEVNAGDNGKSAGEPVIDETASPEIVDNESSGDKTISDGAVPEESDNAENVDNGEAIDDSTNTPPPDTEEADSSAEDNTDANKETAEQEDLYDPAAILQAWRSGDAAGLSGKNKRILDACAEIIAYVTKDTMSDYEKELAVHDWIIDWVSYDEEAASNSPFAKPDPDNDNPYGALYSRKAICSGYTSTFQLFMDMLGIECITVNGHYSRTGEKHAWNMVRIEGEWYNVDTTWNDPIGGFVPSSARHKYFNVTSQYMRDTGHEWDESLTPIADAGKLYRE